MIIRQLIKKLARQNVQITVQDNNLRISAPEGVITPDIKRILSEQKQNIIDTLTNDTRGYSSINRNEFTQPVEISFSQRRLWLIHQMDMQSSTNYNMFSAFEILGQLNTNILICCFQEIVNRHEIFRTTFNMHENKTIQVVNDNFHLDLPLINIKESDLSSHLEQHYSHVFDLSAGPIIMIKLFQLTPQRHVLSINMHHIISDGWSFSILCKEISTLYKEHLFDLPASLPSLPFQYVDFTVWQQKLLLNSIFNKQLHYWKNQLQGASTLLELPTDKPRPAIQHYHGSSIPFTIPVKLTSQLKRLSQANRSTLYMTLLATFAVLLARYSGQHDICIGTSIAGRQQPELEKLIGFFVNTLVIRTKINDAKTFIDLLHQIRETTLSAHSHQDVPFDRIVEELNPTRSQSFTPLFQVMFSLQNIPNEKFNLPGTTISPIDRTATTTLFDLSMDLVESDNALSGTILYSTDLFEKSTMQHLLTNYQTILEQIVCNPSIAINNIIGLNKSDYYKVLLKWNNTSNTPSNSFCLQTWFEEQVELTPQSQAVIYQNEKITYEELNRKSNILAHYLNEQYIGADSPVGLCLENSIELIIALLGILKSGGAYVPVSPSFSLQRIEYILNDSKCELLITQQKFNNTLFKTYKNYHFLMDSDWNKISNYNHNNPTLRAIPENLAYILYTSGSTGEPKGVMTTHGAFHNQLTWMLQTFKFSKNDNILFKTPLIFDIAGWEWALPLITGSRLVVAPIDTHQNPEKLLTVIKNKKINILQVVPSLLNQLVVSSNISKMHSLKHVFCAGEILPTSLYNTFKSLNLNAQLYNIYGPTETTINSTHWSSSLQRYLKPIPIGRPIFNNQIYILNNELKPIPIGAKGEIFIAGEGVARGYINNPTLTAEKFIPNPFSNIPGTRLYQTGDFARYLADGAIEYIGRMDHQVKIRGVRIELGEIENTLLKHPLIKEAAVIVHSNKLDTLNQRLTAYIVPQKHQLIDQAKLQESLLNTLADYMVPTSYIFLEQLPLTANGKINRKLLFNEVYNYLNKETYNPAQTDTQRGLLEIWCTTLNVNIDNIGVNDNFFDLGGHSLLANEMINKIKKKFNIAVTIRDIFTSPTIKQLAVVVDNNVNQASTTIIKSIKDNIKVPLSLSQQRFWSISTNQNKNNISNIQSAIRLRGKLDVTALHEALILLIQRHKSLRTTFHTVAGIPFQVTSDHITPQTPIIDITEHDLDNTLHTLFSNTFSLLNGPLFTFNLLRLSKNDFVLTINISHIIADGYSLSIIYRELNSLYSCFIKRNVSLPQLKNSSSYSHFVYWQQEQIRNGKYTRHQKYWKNELKNTKIYCTLPEKSTFQKNKNQSYFLSYKFSFSSELIQQLQQLTRTQNTTLFMVLITGFNILLAHQSNQDDICILFDDANRQLEEFSNTVGLFANTLLLRMHVQSSMTFINLLKAVQSKVLAAIDHQNISFNDLKQSISTELDPNQTSFPFAFALQRNTHGVLSLPNVTTSMIELKSPVLNVGLGMNISVDSLENLISGEIIYNADQYSGNLIEVLCDNYVELLAKFMAIPNTSIKNFTPTNASTHLYSHE